MKPLILLFALAAFAAKSNAQNIGIGTTSPHSSAQLDITSTTKGLLTPRMTTTQRNAIASPTKGLLVYDTDLNSLFHYNGSAWAAVGGGGGGLTLPYEASINTAVPGIKITNSGNGPAIQAITTNEFGYALSGIANSGFGYGVFGYAAQPDAVAVYGSAENATAVKGYSVGGLGIDARSTNHSALKASIILGANANPAILASHAGGGIAVDASSNTGSAIKGTSGASTLVQGSVVGTNTNASGGNGVYGSALGAGGSGVRGESTAGTGVTGYSNNNTGVSAGTLGGTALFASAIGGTALKGSSSSGYGLDVSGKVKIAGGNTSPSAGAVLTSLDANGNAVWKTSKVGFFASSSTFFNQDANDEATTTMTFNENPYDPGNDFNLDAAATDKNTFVVPVSGFYHLEASCLLRLNSTTTNLQDGSIAITLNGTEVQWSSGFAPNNSSTDSNMPLSIGTTRHFNAGDKITMRVYSNNLAGLSVRIENKFFSGFLVFAD